MRDCRVVPANDRVAHLSLRGQVAGVAFVAGEWGRVIVPMADLLEAPGGRRARQVILGERFLTLERRNGLAFGQAERDAYVGYLAETALGPDGAATHWVCAPATHLYASADIKRPEVALLTLGARLTVRREVDARFVETDQGLFALRPHLAVIGDRATDPVAVAMGFLGTPYLWGGNSRSGIDCSGLVQAAHLACGIACPGDADLQEAALGRELPPGVPLARGDLLFWDGHVALAVDGGTLIHAAGHQMAVVLEGAEACMARIAAQTGGGATSRKRL